MGCFGTLIILLLYGVLFAPILSLIPWLVIFSSLFGSLIQRSLLRRFGITIAGVPQFTIAWIICHALGWAAMAHGIAIASILNWLAFQRSSFEPFSVLVYLGVGTVVGFVLGGIQLLVWRRSLRPQILWLGLSGLSWVVSALLVAGVLNSLVVTGLVAQDGVAWFIVILLVSAGTAIAWFAQAAIAGGFFVPILRKDGRV